MASILAMHPEWVTDPVPPWIEKILDERGLKELALIRFEYEQVLIDAERRVLDQRAESVKRAQAVIQGS